MSASRTVRLSLNTVDFKRGLAAMRAKYPNALKRAVKRAADSGRIAMAREIAADTGLPVRKVRDEIKVGQLGDFGATIEVQGARLPLIDFNARGPEPSRGKGRGVSYRLGKGGRGRVPNAFIATVGRGGRRGVFVRRETKRLPIVELHGPSLVKVFTKFLAVAEARAKGALITNIRHEIRFALRR